MTVFSAGDTVEGRYRVLSLLGEGGMNRVYLVEEINAGAAKKAMKVTRDLSEVQSSSREVYNQFLKEISILTTLKHRGLPEVFDYFSTGDHHFVVEEYIEGLTLEEYTKKTRIDDIDIVDWAIELCEVLELLHKNNIVFRDLKPANVIVTVTGALKLIDFDIARYYKQGKTSDTFLLGTPGYAAPETYGKAQSDSRSDIYSLGATMHQLLTGMDPQDHPFTFEPLASCRPGTDRELARVIEKALSIKPENRYPIIMVMKKDLQAVRRRLFPQRVSPFPGSPQISAPSPAAQPGLTSQGPSGSAQQKTAIPGYLSVPSNWNSNFIGFLKGCFFVSLLSLPVFFFIIVAIALYQPQKKDAGAERVLTYEDALKMFDSQVNEIIRIPLTSDSSPRITPDWNGFLSDIPHGRGTKTAPDTFAWFIYDKSDRGSVNFAMSRRECAIRIIPSKRDGVQYITAEVAFRVRAEARPGSPYGKRSSLFSFSGEFAYPESDSYLINAGSYTRMPGTDVSSSFRSRSCSILGQSRSCEARTANDLVFGEIRWKPYYTLKSMGSVDRMPWKSPRFVFEVKGRSYHWIYSRGFTF